MKKIELDVEHLTKLFQQGKRLQELAKECLMFSFLFSQLAAVLLRPKRAVVRLVRLEDFDDEPCYAVVMNGEGPPRSIGRRIFLLNLEPGEEIWIADIKEEDLIEQ